ncbi:(ribosomal protein S18)-alanine N-acetyltransferase [Azospirillaceae bacterium]
MSAARGRETRRASPEAGVYSALPEVFFRPAVPADIPVLLRIESACFCGDRLSSRSFRHLLTRGHAACTVMIHGNLIVGYALVLFSVARSWGRLYSFAIDPPFQSKGLGGVLLSVAEQAVRMRRRDRLRLEVRRDNLSAIALYLKQGYRQFGVYADYYEDHMEALRLEKTLGPFEAPVLSVTP